MKQIILVLILFSVLVSCKEEAVKEPNHLIEKDVMVDIMYDLSVLEAIKYQNPNSLETKEISPKEYILKKYKIDSLQFAQSNNYYAADYKEYKMMFDQISKRLDDNKVALESLMESKRRKALLLKKKKTTVEKKQDTLKKE